MRPGDCINCGHSRNVHGIPECGSRVDLFSPGAPLLDPCPCDQPQFLGSLDFRPKLSEPDPIGVSWTMVPNGRGGNIPSLRQCSVCSAAVGYPDGGLVRHVEWHRELGA